MWLKRFFCKHNWEKQKIQLTSISFTYVADTPTEEFRTYTVSYHCKKCGESQVKEKYIEKGISDEERKILVEESERYAQAIERK